jgi:hypothetical protein
MRKSPLSVIPGAVIAIVMLSTAVRLGGPARLCTDKLALRKYCSTKNCSSHQKESPYGSTDVPMHLVDCLVD